MNPDFESRRNQNTHMYLIVTVYCWSIKREKKTQLNFAYVIPFFLWHLQKFVIFFFFSSSFMSYKCIYTLFSRWLFLCLCSSSWSGGLILWHSVCPINCVCYLRFFGYVLIHCDLYEGIVIGDLWSAICITFRPPLLHYAEKQNSHTKCEILLSSTDNRQPTTRHFHFYLFLLTILTLWLFL